MAETGELRKPKAAGTNKTCVCRLVGNGVNLSIGDVTLEPSADMKRFAKKAYQLAASSLKKLELPGYRIVVHDAGAEFTFALEELRR